MNIKKLTTRQYLMLGIILVFVMTLFLGNYGVYTYTNHERYVIKESLMTDIEDNVALLEEALRSEEKNLDLFKALYEKQLLGESSHSIVENYHMTVMTYDENISRTYNPEVTMDGNGMLMIYDGLLKNMPMDLRVECNMIFDAYGETQFLYEELIPKQKLVLNSSYGYTSIIPYDKEIDGNKRERLVDYYENFNNLSTEDLNKWTLQNLPSDEAFYIGKTSALTGNASDRYLLTQLMPLKQVAQSLHRYEKPYEFYVLDSESNVLINNFEVVTYTDGNLPSIDQLISGIEIDETTMYPFVQKLKNDYIVGHPVAGSEWKVYAVFNEKSIGKNTLFKTSGFYMLNILFIGIFSFLVVVVNKHLTEQEK